MNRRRSIKLIVIILVTGALLGTLIGEILAYALPEGVVKQFFLQSITVSLGGENGLSLDLGILGFILGFRFKLNFVALFGLAAAYYFLRYFR
ncbi:MAG: DUF4321 domain-containing protein [Fidelibacterota bacterium]